MIRVFSATDTDFSTNGDAVISPIKSRVKNNINGEFSYELTCEAKFYDYLRENKLLLVDTPQGVQPFRINNNVTRKGNRITVKARHVFYDSDSLVIADSYAVDMTCKQAMEHFNEATDTPSPFTMASNITDLNTFRCVRKSLLEALNTILERWGGYLIRDYWNITINNSIGQDNGITIEYKKNLQELTANYDFNNVVTKALPVGKEGVLLPELYVYAPIQYEIPYTKVISISQDINQDDYATEEEYQQALIADLRDQAEKYVRANCYPLITYTLKGKPEVVSDIGDIIRVNDTRIGVDITTQVIGYEYDTITGSYASLTFGNFAQGLGDLMSDVKSTANEVVNEAMGEVRGSINKIYDLLQGSYVVYRGYDILVLDAIPMSVAQHVLRFSNNGISISEDGVNGTYKEIYSLETQTLTVPKLLLDGLDVKTELEKKLEASNIQEGDGIKITRNGKNLTIATAGSGALKYWVEENTNLYRKTIERVRNEFGWICDEDYLYNVNEGESLYACDITFNYANGGHQRWCGFATTGASVIPSTGDFQACFGLCSVNGNYGIVAVAGQAQTMLHMYHSGNARCEAFSYKGVTLYYSILICGTITSIAEAYTYNDYAWQTEVSTYFNSTNPLPYIGDYTSALECAKGLIEVSHFCTNIVRFTGLSIDNNSSWGGVVYLLGDGSNITPSEMPFNVTENGIVNGKDFRIDGVSIDNVRDVKVDGFSVVSNHVAEINLSTKQDKLIAGSNITIANDGKTISATNTDEVSELADVSLSNLTSGQVLKYNSTSQKWENANESGGGSEVIPNPQETATDTLTKIGIDGTVYSIEGGGGDSSAREISWSDYQALTQAEKENGTQYYVPDAPTSYPYLTMENGVLTIVYDDGE